MEQSGDILLKKGKRAFALTLSFFLLTGCSAVKIDEFRPEVNRSGGLVVFPESFEDQAQAMAEDDGVAGEGGSGSGSVELPEMEAPGGDKEGIVEGGDTILNEDGLTNEKTTEQTLSCTSYGNYLAKYVTEPVRAELDALGQDTAKHIYFRVVHTGYDPMGIDNSTVMELAAPYRDSVIGSTVSGEGVGGLAFSQFAFDYLYSLPDNRKVADNQRQNSLNVLGRSGSISPSTSWTSVDRDDIPFSGTYIAMWGNERLGAEARFSDYLAAIRKSMVGTIPNLGMYVKTSANSRGTYVKLNECTANTPRYVDSVSISTINYIFNTYNCHEDHKVSKVLEGFDVDDNAMVWYRSDGWSKTIVLFGTDGGHTLPGLLGASYDSIKLILSSIKPHTDWAAITALEGMENASTISAGARGTS